jgi:hypothetical protein
MVFIIQTLQAQTNNPCKSPITEESINPNKFFFESAFHNDRLTLAYRFAVVVEGGTEPQQEWEIPKASAVLAFTPPSPGTPCYSTTFTPVETLNRTGQIKYTNKYKIKYDAPLGDSAWSSSGNPFRLMTVPFVGETRSGR